MLVTLLVTCADDMCVHIISYAQATSRVTNIVKTRLCKLTFQNYAKPYTTPLK